MTFVSEGGIATHPGCIYLPRFDKSRAWHGTRRSLQAWLRRFSAMELERGVVFQFGACLTRIQDNHKR